MLGVWVEGGWVGELTVVILRVEGGDGGLSNNDELINVLLVGHVLVEVVLEMLEEVHVLLNEVVSSDSLEGEGAVEELVGLYSHFWVFALSFHLSVDGHGVVVVSLIEVSGEVVELLVEGGLIDLASCTKIGCSLSSCTRPRPMPQFGRLPLFYKRLCL